MHDPVDNNTILIILFHVLFSKMMLSFFSSFVTVGTYLFRILSCFKLNPFEYLKLPFDASPEEVKRQYRKVIVLSMKSGLVSSQAILLMYFRVHLIHLKISNHL